MEEKERMYERIIKINNFIEDTHEHEPRELLRKPSQTEAYDYAYNYDYDYDYEYMGIFIYFLFL